MRNIVTDIVNAAHYPVGIIKGFYQNMKEAF